MASLKPREDYVLLKYIKADKSEGGVVLPEVSKEGDIWRVVAWGPKVEGLKVDIRVLIIGAIGQDVVHISRSVQDSKDLYLTRGSNIILVVEED